MLQNSKTKNDASKRYDYESDITRKENVIVISMVSIIEFGIFAGLLSSQLYLEAFFLIIGALMSVLALRFLFIHGEEPSEAIKYAFGFMLVMVIVVVSMIYLSPPDAFWFTLPGFLLTFLLMYIRQFPYRIQFHTEVIGSRVHLTRMTNYLIAQTSVERSFSKQTTISLKIEKRGLSSLIGPRNYWNTLSFEDQYNSIDPVPFIPVKMRGLAALSLLVRILPEGMYIRSNRLDRSTGGLLSSLEPVVKGVHLAIPVRTDIGEPLEVEKLREILSTSYLKPIVYPRRLYLMGQILWGLFVFSFFSFFTVFFILASYLLLFDGGLLLSLGYFASGLFTLVVNVLMLNKSVIQQLVFFIGDLTFEEREQRIDLMFKRSFLRSHTYKIPLNLNPRIITRDGKYWIICRDETKEYYNLPIAEITH